MNLIASHFTIRGEKRVSVRNTQSKANGVTLDAEFY